MCHIPDIKITGCADGFGCGVWGKEEFGIIPRFLASGILWMMAPLANIWKTGHEAVLLRKLIVQVFSVVNMRGHLAIWDVKKLAS